jgi:hypothetical protein
MQPIYIRKLEHQKPVSLSVKSYDNNSLETLKTCFDVTDWEIFIDNSLHIDELTETVTDYINFCCDAILPSRLVKIYPNNSPWMTSQLRKLIVQRHNMDRGDKDIFKQKCKEVKKAIAKAKENYRNKIEQMFSSKNTKQAWEGLRVITH